MDIEIEFKKFEAWGRESREGEWDETKCADLPRKTWFELCGIPRSAIFVLLSARFQSERVYLLHIYTLQQARVPRKRYRNKASCVPKRSFLRTFCFTGLVYFHAHFFPGERISA